MVNFVAVARPFSVCMSLVTKIWEHDENSFFIYLFFCLNSESLHIVIYLSNLMEEGAAKISALNQ